MMFLKFIIALICATSVASAGYNLLTGMSGTGKSYIATLVGCPSPSCSGQQSCTTETKICDNGTIDAVGVDDNGEYTVTKTDGTTTVLSGLSYPLYNLLDTLERSRIDTVTLFHVVDANNIRDGKVATDFYNFMEKTLGCKSKVILNKYRDELKSKVKGGEILVNEGQKTAPILKGDSCKLSLPANWRDLLIDQDVTALKAAVASQRCTALGSRKRDLEAAANHLKAQPDEAHDGNTCQYWGETGGRWCRGIKMFGKCSDWEPNRGWKTDHDCVRSRDIANGDRSTRNANKRKLISEYAAAATSLNDSMNQLQCT